MRIQKEIVNSIMDKAVSIGWRKNGVTVENTSIELMLNFLNESESLIREMFYVVEAFRDELKSEKNDRRVWLESVFRRVRDGSDPGNVA